MAFEAAAGLDEKVAAMIAGDITRIARDIADGAKVVAPAEKVWVTVGDDLVRDTHRRANGQAVPDNLRFTLKVPRYDQDHSGAGPREMARHPRDENLTDGNFYECRCSMNIVPDGVSRTIRADPAHVTGTRVESRAVCDHKLATPAEFGNSIDTPARFMRAGITYATARLR